jgi:hypothetical protein
MGIVQQLLYQAAVRERADAGDLSQPVAIPVIVPGVLG